ncbi:MAG: leucine-rich repeat domain-containing protein [Lachnospiraceae bacterium]|nr:leucine-rich repeat domain-containing protein [Lachnospiraceae bacterium]
MEQAHRIPDYAYAGNEKLQKIEIPEGTKVIGKHAFYNCRYLETVILPHGSIEIEDGAFKNCQRVSHIILRKGEDNCNCLKDILYDMNHEIKVTVIYSEQDCAVLLFPHYEYEYIANEPARIFSEVGYGTGYLYQQCFFDSRIDYPRYDSLWKRACVSEEISVLARILSYRLRFPHQLSEDCSSMYEQYFKEHTRELLTWYMKEPDMDSLHFFLEGDNVDVKLLTLAGEIAASLERPELISYVLDVKNRTAGDDKKGAGKFAL